MLNRWKKKFLKNLIHHRLFKKCSAVKSSTFVALFKKRNRQKKETKTKKETILINRQKKKRDNFN